MPTRKAPNLHQHETLRVPAGWKEQDRMLIVQLERILDDIYKRFGRLAWEDLSAVLQAKLATLDNDGHVLSDELPLATSSARGAVKIGYTETGKKYAVQLDSEKMYVNVPWEDTKNSAGTKDKLHTKLYLVGAQTQAANPQTSSNRYVYIGTDDCLYSNDQKVVDASQIYFGTDKNASGFALDARIGKLLDARITAAMRGIAYIAVLSNGDWKLSSGTNASIGDFIFCNGILGWATAAIVGGTDSIVEGTNWEKVPEGAANKLQAVKADKGSSTWGDLAGQ